MLKLGNVISKIDDSFEKVNISEFSIENDCTWTQPVERKIKIEKTSFASGGYREVFKASFRQGGNLLVVKKFLPSSLEAIDQINNAVGVSESAETFAKRAIQAHLLAKNFADQFRASLSTDLKASFGKTFAYGKAMLGELDSGDIIMMEDFVPGEFSKYINNDGIPVPPSDDSKKI